MKINTATNLPTKTLAQQLRWQTLLVGVVFCFAILLSLSVLMIRTMDFASDSFIKLEAHNMLKQLTRDPDMTLPTDVNYQAYRHWQEIPQEVQRVFPQAEIESNEVLEKEIADKEGRVKYFSMLHYVNDHKASIFLISINDVEEIDDVLELIVNNMLVEAIWLIVMIFVGLFLFVYWLLKRTNEPMVLLSEWAKRLKDNDQLNRDDFPIAELNDLAAQLKTGVDRITEYNLREQQFLKHASHEMRTPLATIQACLDTLDFKLTGPERTTVQRALKASLNMNRLSSALLWLARESEKPIEKTSVNVDKFCRQQVADHQYLITNRKVEIKCDIDVESMDIEEDLLLIVFANLLRNACQFTSEGRIHIKLNEQSLSIQNPVEANKSVNPSNYQSFGLGLQLVERICQKLNWQFSFVEEANYVQVSVFWQSE